MKIRTNYRILSFIFSLHTAIICFSQNSTYQLGDILYFRDRYPYQERTAKTICRGIGQHCYIFVEDSAWNKLGFINQEIVDDVITSFENRSSNESYDSTKGIFELETELLGLNYNFSDKIIIVFIKHEGITDGWTFAIENPDHFYVTANAHTRWTNQRPDYYNHVVSHEFFHVIDFSVSSVNPDMGLLSEGCAEFASYLCGYYEPGLKDTISYHHLTGYSNLSLIPYDNRMNYALGFTFILYLYEKYGGIETIQKLVKKSGDDIIAINDVLLEQGYIKTFKDIFPEWQTAIYLDYLTPGNSIYKFESIQISPFSHAANYNIYPFDKVTDNVNQWAGKFISFKGEKGTVIKLNGNENIYFTLIQRTKDKEIYTKKLDYNENHQCTFQFTDEDSVTILVSNVSSSAVDYSYSSDAGLIINSENQSIAYFNCFPNPVSLKTTIKFTLNMPTHVELSVFDIRGQKIETLINNTFSEGKHSIEWNLQGLPNGIYLCYLKTNFSNKIFKILKVEH